MKTYRYVGPVKEFDRVIANNWIGVTEAASESKARSNLAYQFKLKNNRTPNSRISLPGKMIVS